MYINFTNALPSEDGKPIAIKKEVIISFRTTVIMRENGIPENVTYLFCPPHGTWEVKESFEEVQKILTDNKPKKKF